MTEGPLNPRRAALGKLATEMRMTFGFMAEFTTREGRPILVICDDASSVTVGCDMFSDGWWFTWADDDDRSFAQAEQVGEAVCNLVRSLKAAKEGQS